MIPFKYSFHGACGETRKGIRISTLKESQNVLNMTPLRYSFHRDTFKGITEKGVNLTPIKESFDNDSLLGFRTSFGMSTIVFSK